MKSRALLPGILLLFVALASCRKEDDTPDTPSPDFTTAADHARALDYFSDMMDQVDAAAADNGLRDAEDDCAPAVTIDTMAMPHTMTIDFGSVNCTAANGRTRRGMILVSFTGPYAAPGTVITITPQDYYVNDNLVQGTKTVTNMGLNADQVPWFTVVVDAIITAGDGSWTTTHHADRVRTWTAGSGTLDPFDDAYKITGQGNGVNRNGLPYTAAITSPLHVQIGCPFITQGIVQVTPEGLPVRTIDFGDGTCDNLAVFTVGGFSITIILG
ncbi:MAG: hypothetical protein IT230_03905 [Flavobacteriales bacterium]|nr:hypothetical protein [Flavobacteriales bacterium]